MSRRERGPLARLVARDNVVSVSKRVQKSPSGGAQGQATDIEIQAREILNLRKRLNQIYVDHTGQPLEAIEAKLERDSYMSAQEAKEFGIVDDVVKSQPIPGDAKPEPGIDDRTSGK